MDSFQVVMIISATALFMVAALFFMIRKLPSRPGMEWWLGAALCQAFAYLLVLIFCDSEPSFAGDMAFYILQMVVNFGLFIGACLFTRKMVNITNWVKAFFVTALMVAVFRYFQNIALADLSFSLFNSACLLLAGMAFLNRKGVSKDQVKLEKITAACFLFISLHWIDYSFVKNVEWFLPIGFFLGMSFAVSIFLLLATLALLQFQEHTKESEQKAIHASIHDPLTKLYSRGYMGRLFEQYATASENSEYPFAALYMDLDGFKVINDTYGHRTGDLVLAIISKRLKNWLGEKGNALRIGGDEILIFSTLRGDCHKENVQGLAESILSLVEDPIIDGNYQYNLSASIGVCVYPVHGKSLDQIVAIADDLMYQAKNAGKGTIHYANFPLSEKSDFKSLDPLLSSPQE